MVIGRTVGQSPGIALSLSLRKGILAGQQVGKWGLLPQGDKP